jgi:hypothetical protein
MPILIAIEFLLKYIWKYGTDPNRTKDGNIPLQRACYSSQIFNMLIKYGATLQYPEWSALI